MEKMKYYAVGWFEIYVQEMARARKFYEEVFQVKLTDLSDPTDQNMKMAAFPFSMEDLPGASGALVQMEGYPSGGNSTIVYFTSLDCSVEESRAKATGGKVIQPKTSIGERGFISLIEDTEGNTVGGHSMK